MSHDQIGDIPFLSRIQTQRNAFEGVIPSSVLQLRAYDGVWCFGQEIITSAACMFMNEPVLAERIKIGLVNEPSLTATWYKQSDSQDSYTIAINTGLVTALNLIASDVFGYGDEAEDEPLLLAHHDAAAAHRVSERIAAFLEVGYPLGNAVTPSDRRLPFVRALVDDAIQFLVLHEFAHILLGHDRGEVHVLRSRMVDFQIATFSMGQEHQADKLACRLHALMRRSAQSRFPGMEFGGPSLLFGLLGLFERYSRYRDTFDTSHAHPGAYERLYRLRVAFTSGSNSDFTPLFFDGKLTIAQPLAEPNPGAVRFSDAIAESLLSVLSVIEEEQIIPSPINALFNRYCNTDVSTIDLEEFWSEIARWLFLGSPAKIFHHLAEAKQALECDIKDRQGEEQQEFRLRANSLITEAVRRAKQIDDYSVKKALGKYHAMMNQFHDA